MRLISKLLCSAVLVSASMAASAYSSLVVFGDSLSDSGNNKALGFYDPLKPISGNDYVPRDTYSSGVYSNGPVWATQFADKLGLSLTPSLAGGTNYAFGGAQTSYYSDGTDGTDPTTPSLKMQAATYLGPRTTGVSPPGADATGLYVVAGGGNNLRDTLKAVGIAAFLGNYTSIPGIIIDAAVAFAKDIVGIVASLRAAGAQDIIVWNAPNLGLAPAALASGEQAAASATQISQTFNAVLAGALLQSGISGVKTFDIYGLVGQAAANGFTNTTDACGAISNANCSNYLFWDGIHPTTAAHSLIAQNMYVTAVPEPETLVLMVMGIGLIALRARRRAAELQAA